jgi:hypothetical protein
MLMSSGGIKCLFFMEMHEVAKNTAIELESDDTFFE